MKRLISSAIFLLLVYGNAYSENELITGRDRFFSRPHLSRSIWIWGEGAELLNNSFARGDFFKFLKNPHGSGQAITNIYLDCKTFYLKDENWKKKMVTFIKQAHSNGVCVQFLAGNPAWGHQRYEVINIINAVSEYNSEQPLESRLDGIHLDIEPYTLPIWHTNDKFREKFFESVEKYGELMRNINPNIVFGLDVPTFWNEQETRRLLGAVDYLTLMNYTDNASLMADRAKRFVDIALKMDKKIESGIETQAPSKRWGVDYPITFYDEGWKLMEEILAKVVDKLGSSPAFIGFAVHYLESYRKMNKERKIVKDSTVYPSQETIKIYYAESPIKIDADVSDWKTGGKVFIGEKENLIYEAVKGNWNGASDLSCHARFAWNEDGLYALFEVLDDKIVQNYVKEQMINGDHIEFWLDTDYESDEALPYATDDDYQIGISPGNFSDVEKSIWVFVPSSFDQSKIKSVEYAVKRTESGYIVEMFYPNGFFDNFTPHAGKKIRLNIDPSDTDSDSNTQETLLSSSICRQYGNPRTFRMGEFVK